MAKFILSKSKAIEQYKKAKELADIVSYSSKTNPDVTPILEAETDAMFNIHTVNELKRVKDKSRVYFLAQGWSQEQIKSLLNQGVFRFIVDNETDLDTFLKTGVSDVELLLRVKLKERTLKTERYFVFGMACAVVSKRILELKGKVKTLGIHFHRKTQNMAEWNLIHEVSNMFEPEVLDAIDVLDVGGGLPSVYANTNVKVFYSIYNKLKELRGWLNEKSVKLMIEPGRFICAPCVKLVTNVIAVYENNIIVDASVYNSDTDAFVVPAKLLVEGEGSGKAYVIKGVTPCSMDIFRYRVYLENVGSEIVFLNAGAYNFSTDFCDLERLETEVVL
tara:strand:- start:1957 stop:2955 length:999 start_codon:yes stop_codon:yes gene_type:complete